MKRIFVAAAALVLGMAVVSASTAPEATAFTGEIFEIVGSGKEFHFDSQPPAGKKAFTNTFKSLAVSQCITGVGPIAGSCGAFLEQDAGGKAYLFMDSQTSWRVGTKTDGSNAMALTGLVDGAGNFMFGGVHAKSGSQVMITGKVKYAKGTYTPTAVAGKVMGVSTLTRHYVTGGFKTLGKPLT